MSRPLLLLSLIASLAACSKPAPAAPVPRAVRTVALQPRELSQARRFSGALEPAERLELRFPVPGTVAALGELEGRPLQEGDRVARGAVLARLDEAELRLQSGVAASALANARALEEGARTAAGQAKIEVERARTLFSSSAIPRAELDRAEAAVRGAAAAEEAASASRRAKADQAALARSALEDATLRAPREGVISRRFVDVGEVVAPGAAAFTLIDVGSLRALFALPASTVATLPIGQRVAVRVDGEAEARVGRVTKLQPEADPQLRSFQVEVTLENADGRLRPGLVATLALEEPDAPTLRALPLLSIVRGDAPGSYAVFTVDDGLAAKRSVTLGALVGNEVVVLGGLPDGARVVTQGAALLREGERVEVLP